MNWYKSQLITTAILAAWNIGVLFALCTGLVSLLVLRELGIEELAGNEGTVVMILSITVGITAATLSGRKIIPALQRLSRIWGTVVFMALIFCTFALMPTKFAFMPL